jgi:hypothetical protein
MGAQYPAPEECLSGWLLAKHRKVLQTRVCKRQRLICAYFCIFGIRMYDELGLDNDLYWSSRTWAKTRLA